jgi:hypothetical protein
MELSKPVLSRKKFIKESGFPETYVDKAIHSEWGEDFSFKTSDALNAVIYIDVEAFEKLHRKGVFK